MAHRLCAREGQQLLLPRVVVSRLENEFSYVEASEDEGRRHVGGIIRQLRVLQDIEDIRRLRMLYHYFINEGLFDRAWEIYTEDAYVVWSSAGTARGHTEIVALFNTLPTRADFVKHFVSNHIVDVNGDEATGLAYVDARYAGDGESSFIAGKYDERYRRTPEGWRIAAVQNGRQRPAAIPEPDSMPSKMSQAMTRLAQRLGIGRAREVTLP